MNFINEVTEIAAAQMKCLKERNARKEKSNYGNQVTEMVGEERKILIGIVAMKLPKMKEKKIVVMKLSKIGGVS